MFSLGSASRSKLVGVHPDLVRVVERAIQLTPIDFKVTCGTRTVAEQRILVKEKKSKTMNSRHIPGADGLGKAIDFVALVSGQVSWKQADYVTIAEAFFKAATELGVAIRWGGSWSTSTAGWQANSFFDGPHVELLASAYP